MKLLSSFILLVFTLVLITASAVSPLSIPERPGAYVVDLAGIIDDGTEGRLNGYFRELEEKTTAQMVVLSIASLEGASIEEVSITIAHDKWKIGQKGKDNGVLLLVAVEDRKYRFEVGYGLEGVLPDSFVGTVGREYLIPAFRKGDYSTGIMTASLAVMKAIASDAGIQISGIPAMQYPSRRGIHRGKPSLASKIFGILFFIGLVYLFIRHPRLLLLLIMMNMVGGGRRSGWGSGGGFGGGGGFSGGGGGFGGGGASGGW